MQQDQINILVTSAGTASAISVIRSLKNQNDLPVSITAVDSDILAAGLYLADNFEIIPKADHPNYIESIIQVSKKYNARILIPIYSKEIAVIAKHKEILAKSGIQTFISDTSTIDICNDKRLMNQVASDSGLRVAKIFSTDEVEKFTENDLPVFVKPNSGSSSSGAELVRDLNRLKERNKESNLVVQSVLKGEEVTVDVLCNENSDAIVIAPRLRLATKSGQSVKAETISSSDFENQVSLICKKMKIRGVCNLQFFMDEGKLYFIELNPRFAAGGLMLTIMSGANIPLLLLKLILQLPINKEECLTKRGYKMSRFWSEVVLDEKGRRL